MKNILKIVQNVSGVETFKSESLELKKIIIFSEIFGIFVNVKLQVQCFVRILNDIFNSNKLKSIIIYVMRTINTKQMHIRS